MYNLFFFFLRKKTGIKVELGKQKEKVKNKEVKVRKSGWWGERERMPGKREETQMR